MTDAKGSTLVETSSQVGSDGCADVLRLGNFLCFSVYSAGHAFTRAYKPLLDRLGLTYPQYLVMVSLWEEDGQTVGGLGGRLGLESNTLTPLVKRLETMGLVTRQRDRQDERLVRVNLSDQGRALRSGAAGIPLCLGSATGLTVEEARQMQADLTRLRLALEDATPLLAAALDQTRA